MSQNMILESVYLQFVSSSLIEPYGGNFTYDKSLGLGGDSGKIDR